jgi:meiotic recombination protein SPO11
MSTCSLTTPDIKWLGVRPSDLDRYGIPDQCRLPMTPQDIKIGQASMLCHFCGELELEEVTAELTGLCAKVFQSAQELLREDFIQANAAWAKELELMLSLGVKAEIQSLSSFDFRKSLCLFFCKWSW